MDFLPPFPQADRRFFWTITVVVLVLTSIPYVVGAVYAARHDLVYPAHLVTSPGDASVYYSYMEQARQGRLLFANLFTSEAQTPKLFHPLWLVLGWIARLPLLSVPLVFHLARLAVGALFLWVAYRFLALFLDEQRTRRIAFVLLAFSSGFGFFLSLSVGAFPFLGQPPLDYWVSEGNTFLSLTHSALFPLSQLLILLALTYFFRPDTPSRRATLLVGAVLVALSVMHTYDVVIVGAVAGLFFFLQIVTGLFASTREGVRYLRRFAILAVVFVGAGYFLWVIATEPAVAGWVRRNVTTSPRLHHYLAAYGLLIPLAGIGAWQSIRRNGRRGWFLITWLLATFILIYLPFVQIQRRFINGAHIPLSILAAVGVAWILARVRWRRSSVLRRLALATGGAVVAVGLFSTTLSVVYYHSRYLVGGRDTFYVPYVSRDFAAAATWYRDHATPDDVVLSAAYTGYFLAGMTGRTVFMGHGHQTAEWERKKDEAAAFFTNGMSLDAEQAFLAARRITYLWLGDRERQNGSQYDPLRRPFWEEVFRTGSIAIYRYRPSRVGTATEPSDASAPSVSAIRSL